MILTCPQCATRYTVDGSKFPPEGRNVRCAKCGNVWHEKTAEVAPPWAGAVEAASPPEPEAAPAATPAVEPAPPPEPVAAAIFPAAEARSAFAMPAEPEAPARRAYVPPAAESDEAGADEAQHSAPARRRRSGGAGALLGWAALVIVVLVIGWAAVGERQMVATFWPRTASFYAALGLDVNPRGLAFTDVAYHREVQDGEAVLAVTGKLVNVSSKDMAVPEIMVALSDADRRELYHWSFAPGVSMLHPGQSVPFLTRLSSPPEGAKHLEVRFAGGE